MATLMEFSHREAERFYLKLFFGGALGLILLIALIWGGHDLYVRWQEKRLVRRAIYAMQHGDNNTASLAAQTVLEIKPASVPAARIVAELAEKSGNRAALDWRRKVVQLQPNSVDDAIALAKCALQFGEEGIAEEALKGIDQEGKDQGGYHAVAGLVAQARGDNQKAEAEWAQAVQLAPDEKAYQLHLGTLQLNSKDESQHAAGRAILQQLRNDPDQRAAATRALITDGVARRENTQQLLDLARELQTYPEATFADRLLFVDFLHQSGSSEFTSYLTELESKAVEQPTDLSSLLAWMSRSNLNVLALDFLKNVPTEQLQKWPVPVSQADLYVRLKEWRKLETITRDANWREGEFIRHAYLARALKGEDKPAAAEHEWAAAVKEASGQGVATMALVKAAADWNWEKEMLDLLWALTRDPERQNDAVQTLYRYYTRTNDTEGLYRALARWAELAPDDLNIQNNFAQVSLLLDVNSAQAQRIAADVYQKSPSNAAYATTYAYSLLTKGNVNGAAKVMQSLTKEQLRDPAVSAYYGICLAAQHDQTAREFLKTGLSAKLLPEEKRLVDKALARLDSDKP